MSEKPKPGPEIHESEPDLEGINHFSHAIVLGKGIKEDQEGDMTGLSTGSKVRILAAGMLAEKGYIDDLIITGGRVEGEENPSVAENMKAYLLKKFPELEDSGISIRLEERSIDTTENAEFTKEMIGDDIDEPVLLITSDFHMVRATEDFENYGFEVKNLSAESVVSKRSEHHEKFLEDYLKSPNMIKNRFIEAALRAVMRIDPSGKLLRDLAKKLRS